MTTARISCLSPISKGGPTTISVPQSGGTVSQTFYARDISNGVAGAGGVRGVATFDMSYD